MRTQEVTRGHKIVFRKIESFYGEHIQYMIRIFSLTQSKYVQMPDGNLTMREWMLQLSPLFPPQIDVDLKTDSFLHSLKFKGADINRFEDRNKLVSSLGFKNGDEIMATLWFFRPPNIASQFKGNLSLTSMEKQDTCTICLQELKMDGNLIIVLDCMHKYHRDCLVRISGTLCPVCRFDFGDKTKQNIKKHDDTWRLIPAI